MILDLYTLWRRSVCDVCGSASQEMVLYHALQPLHTVRHGGIPPLDVVEVTVNEHGSLLSKETEPHPMPPSQEGHHVVFKEVQLYCY